MMALFKNILFKFGTMRIESDRIRVDGLDEVASNPVDTKGNVPTSSTVHNNLVVLKNFYNWCVQEGVLKRKQHQSFPNSK